MNHAWFHTLLCCPQCGSDLKIDTVISCSACDFHDESDKDFRPRRPRKTQMVFTNMLVAQPTETLGQLDTTLPDLTYNGPSAIRDSRQLMSEVNARLPRGGAVLDLGCGPRDQFAPLSYLGFDYVGVDFNSPAADLLVDAHSIPFVDESFDCVFSYAVLEHLHNPFVAIHEISRVLKAGGWFIGTVSQGEPFHSSYFHHTPWGMLSLIVLIHGQTAVI